MRTRCTYGRDADYGCVRTGCTYGCVCVLDVHNVWLCAY